MKGKSFQKLYLILGFLGLALLLGFRLGHGSLFMFMMAFMATLLTLGFFLLFSILSRFTDLKVGRDALGIALVFLIICIITGIVTWNWILSKKEAEGERIIAYVEAYKKEKGHYPKDLKAFTGREYCEYSVDGTSFEVSFERDGWHRTYYNSDIEEWLTRD